MANTARAHHYVPEFYLAGFSLSCERSDSLWVHDREQDKSWQTAPKNIAHQKDFYRVDVKGVEPDAVEKLLGQDESKAADVLRKIAETKLLPEGDDLGILIGFVAIQATRTPYHREWYEGQAAHLAKWKAQTAMGHPQFFERFLEDMRRQGKEVPDFVTRDAMQEFLDDESRYTIEIPREASIQHMADMATDLIPIFAQRSWSLVLVRDPDDDLICSDRPVILVPTGPNPPPFLGYGMTDTEIIMPLNRQMALVGHYGSEGEIFQADSMVVGMFNHRMIYFSHRFVYSARKEFRVSVPTESGAAF